MLRALAVLGLLALSSCATLAALGGASTTAEKVGYLASKASDLDQAVAQAILEARAAKQQAYEARETGQTKTESRIETLIGLAALWGTREVTRRRALKKAKA